MLAKAIWVCSIMFNMTNGREFPHIGDIPMLSEIGTNWINMPILRVLRITDIMSTWSMVSQSEFEQLFRTTSWNKFGI